MRSIRPRKFQSGGVNPGPDPATVGQSRVPATRIGGANAGDPLAARGGSASNAAAAATGTSAQQPSALQQWIAAQQASPKDTTVPFPQINTATPGKPATIGGVPVNQIPTDQWNSIVAANPNWYRWLQDYSQTTGPIAGMSGPTGPVPPGGPATGGTTSGTSSGTSGTTGAGGTTGTTSGSQQNPAPSDQELALQKADQMRAMAAALTTGPTPVGGAAAQAAQQALSGQKPTNPSTGMKRGGKVQPQRFQSGGTPDRTGANAGDPLAAKPASTSTSTAPTDPTGGAYWSWTPAQQQAWSNGATADQVNAMTAPAAAAPAATGPQYTYNPLAPPSANATPPTGFEALPFGTGTSVVQTPAAYAAQIQAQGASPMMTPAAIANQNRVSAMGDPMYGTTVTINGQQVPYNSLTNEQQQMLSYFNSTGQTVPSNFMSTYQGPSAAWNATPYGGGVTQTAPAGSTLVNGAFVNNTGGGFTFPGSFSGAQPASPTASPTPSTSSPGGIGTSPGTFTSNATGSGVGTGSGATGTTPVTSTPAVAQSPTGSAGSGSGLGLKKGGKVPRQHRPRRFQMGGANLGAGGGNWQQALQQMLQQVAPSTGGVPAPAGPVGQLPTGPGFGGFTGLPGPGQAGAGLGGMSPQQAMQMLNGGMGNWSGTQPIGPVAGGAQGMGAAAGAMPPSPGAAAMGAMAGASPGMGQPQMGGPPPGAAAAGMGAMAGAMPGSPGAAAMGALAGASPGAQGGNLQNQAALLQALGQRFQQQPQGGMGGTFGPPQQQQSPAPGAGAPAGSTYGAAATPNQQWGQMLLGSAPGTGLMDQRSQNPLAQQALLRNYMGQLQGGQGMTNPSLLQNAMGQGLGMAEGGSVDKHEHPPAPHPDPEWGLKADANPYPKYAKGGAAVGGGTVSKFDSTKGGPGNLATKAAGKREFAKGGAIHTLDSTKPAPGNLATSQAGKDKFAEGGVAAFARGGKHKSKSVLRRKPKPGQSSTKEPVPIPPYQDQPDYDEDAMGPPPASAAASPAAPSAAPSAGGAPGGGGAGGAGGGGGMAKGGAVCASCGKAHGGACKGMARGGKFAGAKQRAIKKADGGKWIQGAIKHPGALHEQLGVPQGEKIPEKKLNKAAQAGGTLGRRARLAQTMKGFKHSKGGAAACPDCGKKHSGDCKMAAGGVAKLRRGFPNTIKAPKRLAKGGKVRGTGAATKGLKFSGIY